MWDSFLIYLALHPFASSLLPICMGCLFLMLKQKSFLRVAGFVSLCIGIMVGSILHFRWDSFSIHFSDISDKGISRKVNILFVGDSITCEGSRPRGFITKIRSVLPVGFEVVCQKGATSSEIADLLKNRSFQLLPSFIIAQSGINDLLNGRTEKQTLAAQDDLFNQIRSKFPDTNILFIPTHPFFKGDRLINNEFALQSDNSSLWAENLTSFPKNYLLADGIHLNARGNTILATVIARKLISKLS